jgi:hypothetical protein
MDRRRISPSTRQCGLEHLDKIEISNQHAYTSLSNKPTILNQRTRGSHKGFSTLIPEFGDDIP